MVPNKKPIKAPLIPAKPATANNAPRPMPPALSAKPDLKSTAAGDTTPATASVNTELGKAERSNALTAATDATTTVAPAKPAEKLGKKIRRRDEIVNALRAGSRVVHTTAGLYRIVAADGAQSPTSKRRVLSLIQQGILKPNGESDGRIYILDAEAEEKAREEKPTAKQEATSVPAKISLPKKLPKAIHAAHA